METSQFLNLTEIAATQSQNTAPSDWGLISFPKSQQLPNNSNQLPPYTYRRKDGANTVVYVIDEGVNTNHKVRFLMQRIPTLFRAYHQSS